MQSATSRHTAAAEEIEAWIDKLEANRECGNRQGVWFGAPFAPLFVEKVYLRLSNRYLQRERYRALDLACLSILPENQHKGYGTSVLTLLEEVADRKRRILWVENVTPVFAKKLLLKSKDYNMLNPDIPSMDYRGEEAAAYCDEEHSPVSFYRLPQKKGK